MSCPCCPVTKWLFPGLLAAVALSIVPLHSQEKSPGGALAKVPPDALGFIHIKTNELWKAEMFGGLREMLLKAGPPALQAFNKRFSPPLGNVESICVYVTPQNEDLPPTPGLIVAFSEKFDPVKVIKALLPQGAAMNHFDQKYTADRTIDVAIKTLDNRTLLLTRCNLMPRLLSHESKEDGALKKHLGAAAGKAIYAAVNVAELPRDTIEGLPDSLRAIASARDIVLTGDLGKTLALNLRVNYADAAAAKSADEAAMVGLETARKVVAESIKDLEKKVQAPREPGKGGLAEIPQAFNDLFGLAMMKSLDEFLRDPPYKLSGDGLVAELVIDPNNPKTMMYSTGFMAGILMPTMQRTQVAAVQAKSQNNLKQIALAMHAHQAERGFMPAGVFSKDGKKAFLSWRVAILPYLNQKSLYDQFKLTEPWDSETNKKLIAKMPDLFIDAEAPPHKESGQTHYQILLGGGAGFYLNKAGTKLSDITDGTSNTIMIVTASDPTTWTKPVDIVFEASKPLPKLGIGSKAASVAFFDGSVRTLKPNINERTLRAMITRAGGELVGDDE